MTTQYALSLAKIMEEERDGANGFVYLDGVSELVDNAFDEGSETFRIASIQTPSEYVTLYLDEGKGLYDLMSLYSCGKKVVKKSEGKRGLKNRGHRGTTGSLRGRSHIRYVSRPEGKTDPSTLTVDFKGLYGALDTAKKSDQRNLNVVEPHDFFKNSPGEGLTTKMRAFLQECLEHSTHDVIKTFLEGVLANTIPHYFLMAVCYPTMPEAHEEVIQDALEHFRRTYAIALESGKEIIFHPISPIETIPNAVYHLKKENALPFLGKDSASIGGDLCFYIPKSSFDEENNITDCHTGVVASFTVGEQTMWLHNTRIKTSAKKVPPSHMKDMNLVASMKWRLAVLSHGDEMKQKKDKVEKERGVSLVYVDRALGDPIFGDWGARRNAGGVRCEVICSSQAGAEIFWSINTQKNKIKFTGLHPAMKAFLNLVVKNIIDKWSFTGILKGNSITSWDVDEVCSIMENPSAKRTTNLPAPLDSPTASPSPSPSASPSPSPSASPSTPPSPSLSPSQPTIAALLANNALSTNQAAFQNANPTISMVGAHMRITSKSERDVLMELAEILAFDLDQLIQSSSTKANSDMTNIYKSICQLKVHLQGRMGE